MKINRVGGVGETYTDPRNGKMYKCTYAYKDSNGNVDCTWKEIGAIPTNLRTENSQGENSMSEANASQKIPEGKISEKHSEPSKEIVSETNGSEGKISEKQIECPTNKPNKTKYTNYSKK